jgi:hypothetical protein
MLAVLAALVALPTGSATGREPGGQRAMPRAERIAYPSAPRAGYRARHVRQLLNNCAFASAQMLVDKWTTGRRSAPQQLLRRATGIPSADGGPTLGQLRRAVAKVSGIDMRWSPSGGDPMTWPELLARLENGGGALVNVWPEKLPRHYRRWLPNLVAGHSVYVERYEHRKGRLWLMDPLGRGGGFQGEWIDADVLFRAMWHSGKLVWAAATPPPPEPRPPSLSDFKLGVPDVPAVVFSQEPISVAIPFAPHRSDASLPSVRLAGTWEEIAQPEPTPGPAEESGTADAFEPGVGSQREVVPSRTASLGELVELPSPLQSQPPDDDVAPVPFQSLSQPVTVAGRALVAALVAPDQPGDYVLRLELRNGEGEPAGGQAPSLEPVAIRVRGPLAGRIRLQGEPPVEAHRGTVVVLSVKTANLGSAAWGEEAEPVALAAAFGDEAGVTLPLDLASGAKGVLALRVWVGADAGMRTLRITLVDGAGMPLPESEQVDVVLDVLPEGPRAAELH